MFTKPIDLLMLNRLKESYCEIKEGELDAVGVVHSYEDGMPTGSHNTRLTASLKDPPMGLFFLMLLVPDAYPPPPSVWFHDYEDMLEDTWHMAFPRRPEISDGLFPNMNTGYPMWDSYPAFSAKPRKEEKVGLAEAVTSSILSTGRIDLQIKLFCSILLIGGVASTRGLVPAVEERVLNAIPSNEAIDTAEVRLVDRTAWSKLIVFVCIEANGRFLLIFFGTLVLIFCCIETMCILLVLSMEYVPVLVLLVKMFLDIRRFYLVQSGKT